MLRMGAAPRLFRLSSSLTASATNRVNRSDYNFSGDKAMDAPTGTVSLYHRHLFVCFKDAPSWPAQAESAEPNALPARLTAALKLRKNDIPDKLRLTLCEEVDPASRGDVFLFPDSIRYRGLAAEDAETFVEEVLVNGNLKSSSSLQHVQVEEMNGGRHHVFVCAHGSRDARCGSCGPVLVDCFSREIEARGIGHQVDVRACSHVGGHKYAGNVIIFGRTLPQDDTIYGHWYGYVTPQDVNLLLDQHIGQGIIVDKLWRGQMCLSEEEQKEQHRQRSQMDQPEQTCPCGVGRGECAAAMNAQPAPPTPAPAAPPPAKAKHVPAPAPAPAPPAAPPLPTKAKPEATCSMQGAAAAVAAVVALGIGLFFYQSK